MLYGKRIYESQARKSNAKPQKTILNKAFQYKYIFFLMTAVVGSTLIFFAPAYYFISQNYELFKSLAYDTNPSLVRHLEREVVWLAIFMVLSLGFISGLSLLIGSIVTKNLIAPLLRLESHMKELMYGNWHIPDYRVSKDDDFKDLAVTYDYFYRSLKANTEAELKLIEKLSIDQQNREAYAAWKNLILIKRSRLGLHDLPLEDLSIQPLSRKGPKFENKEEPIETDVVSIESALRRRAS
ncbi:MAG: hypothetical protein IPM97_10115 [Bdellovibrionaceae bacterium]|jgi:hypothetical protein|nr:hypothetical protein [Pseudobdellovibrionaceae bacterium]